MRNLAYILFTCLTLFINSNVYAINMEIQKSEILNELERFENELKNIEVEYTASLVK